METLESVLADKRIVITDDRKGARRTWTFVGDGAGLLRVLSGPPGGGEDDER